MWSLRGEARNRPTQGCTKVAAVCDQIRIGTPGSLRLSHIALLGARVRPYGCFRPA
jgi:hypothetical protein